MSGPAPQAGANQQQGGQTAGKTGLPLQRQLFQIGMYAWRIQRLVVTDSTQTYCTVFPVPDTKRNKASEVSEASNI